MKHRFLFVFVLIVAIFVEIFCCVIFAVIVVIVFELLSSSEEMGSSMNRYLTHAYDACSAMTRSQIAMKRHQTKMFSSPREALMCSASPLLNEIVQLT